MVSEVEEINWLTRHTIRYEPMAGIRENYDYNQRCSATVSEFAALLIVSEGDYILGKSPALNSVCGRC